MQRDRLDNSTEEEDEEQDRQYGRKEEGGRGSRSTKSRKSQSCDWMILVQRGSERVTGGFKTLIV